MTKFMTKVGKKVLIYEQIGENVYDSNWPGSHAYKGNEP